MGFLRLGSLIKYIPHPLITGIITGIAVTLFSSQMKDFFGLKIDHLPTNFIEKWQAYFHAFSSFDLTTTLVSLATLSCIIFVRQKLTSIPWGIISIFLATVVCLGFHIPGETILSRFGSIPRLLPHPSLQHIDLSRIAELVSPAITIALLAAIESLLSAVISDRMIGGRHKPNCELIAQGLANMGSILFGGIPATAAIARTATNVKTGGRTPLAGMTHAVVISLIMFLFSSSVGLIPLGALAALLVMVAWNMSELPHFIHIFKAPKSDVLILLTSFFLTVFIDITVALEVGMILAAFLFMKRMIGIRRVIAPSAPTVNHLEQGIEVYDVHGPFFFGVAHHLKELYQKREKIPKIFVLRMTNVPSLDATGMHALHEFHTWCEKEKVSLVLAHVHEDQILILKDFGLGHLIGEEPIIERKVNA
jgi:SulP family sulfate permease